MKIIWNGEEKDIAARLKKENLVISSIKINDVDLVNASLEEALAKPVPGRVVRLETRPAHELLRESLAEAQEYLPRLRSGIDKLREVHLEGDEEAFQSMVESALEGLAWLGLTLQAYIGQFHPSAESERLFTMEYARLAPVLQELETGMKEKNPEKVCDLFEKEIADFLDKLTLLLKEIRN